MIGFNKRDELVKKNYEAGMGQNLDKMQLVD